MIELTREDIVNSLEDGLVNSANPALGGIGPNLPARIGGVDGAVHRAAGIELWEHLQKLPVIGEVEPGLRTRCFPGDCVITEGFKLHVKYIIHAVAPIFDPDNQEESYSILSQLYTRVFDCVGKLSLSSIAIPPIGTRSFGFPKIRSAEIALNEANNFVQKYDTRVKFCLIDQGDFEAYNEILRKYR